ncbi:MAG TPA: FkbM family methyltransferase [Stellaceae bacterium]|nr:FkbM family methyltransferase [Stellaceae bacterium]
MEIEVPPRRVAAVRRVPPLAALQIERAGKPRGAARWRRKLAKAAFRLVHQRLGVPAKGEIVIDPDGRAIPFAADFANTAYIDFAQRSAEGSYEPEVTALFDRLAPAARVVYDIGANWGYYVAVLLSNPRFRGRVHAFEIAPATCAALARLAAACGGGRVECHAFGLSDRSGTAAIAEGMHSALTRITAGAGRPARIEPLDALGLADPDLVKVDVEGHEAQVFAGARRTLARARPAIVFESWFAEPASRAALAALAELGYRFHRLDWRAGRLLLAPLAPGARDDVARALNLLALHPDGPAAIAALLA